MNFLYGFLIGGAIGALFAAVRVVTGWGYTYRPVGGKEHKTPWH